MRVDLTPALILHRQAWRDTSFMLEAYSREYGRVGLIARGARRNKARWRGLLEPLAAARLSWSGRGELRNLTAVEPEARFELSGNRLWGGFYASELVLRLTAREDPHPGIYDSLRSLLRAMADGAPAVVATRFFERDILEAIGYGIPLTIDPETGRAIHPETVYTWHHAHGLFAGQAGRDDVAVPGSALLGLAAGRFQSRADIHAARSLLGAVIASHLGGRPLKTLQTLRAMRQFESTPPTAGT